MFSFLQKYMLPIDEHTFTGRDRHLLPYSSDFSSMVSRDSNAYWKAGLNFPHMYLFAMRINMYFQIVIAVVSSFIAIGAAPIPNAGLLTEKMIYPP